MKRASFTPGPWTVHAKVADSVSTAKGGSVADCVGPDREMREANARLIACAPEMVACLESALKSLRAIEFKLNHFEPELTVEIEELLAKARGEANG